jgi:hypothetical protein
MTILLGIGLHALGGIAAATCYISQKGTTKWSWQTYWIVFCLVAWFVMPLGVSALTVPDLASVLREAPVGVAVKVFLYGALYGFGGMAFALAIRCIGFSMTYGMAIGISAVFGTVVPQILDGTLIANFQKPGGTVVLVAFILSMVGVAVCGRAGFLKERELAAKAEGNSSFDMRKGLWLVDPMHGNTRSVQVGDKSIKTRSVDDVLRELALAHDSFARTAVRLGGLHVELTGEDVTECVGGAAGIREQDLTTNYATFCDPRLNYQQAMELAFVIARTFRRL